METLHWILMELLQYKQAFAFKQCPFLEASTNHLESKNYVKVESIFDERHADWRVQIG